MKQLSSEIFLEDFRYQRLGAVCCFVKSNENCVFFNYHDYANIAFYLTCKNIEQFETTGDTNKIIADNFVIATLWFLTLESYINTLLKVVCFIDCEDFQKYRGRELSPRILSLLSLLDLDHDDFQRSKMNAKLQEFLQFRNEIMHDRHFNKAIKFKHTNFSEIPSLCNQVDIMQSMIISLEIMTYLRGIAINIDFLPKIVIQKDDSFSFVDIDYLYKNLVSPLFVKSLKKHNLKTSLNLNYLERRSPASKKILKNDLIIVIKAIDNNHWSPNLERTNYSEELFNEIKKSIIIPSGTFILPKYQL